MSEVSRLLTINETAEFLRVSRRTVYNLINAGELGTVRVGDRRRIEPDAIQALLDQGRGQKTDGGAHLRS